MTDQPADSDETRVGLRTLPPLLVPAPRDLTISGGVANVRGTSVKRVSGLPAEGYRLRIGAHEPAAHIEATDDAGESHARTTLDQLVRQYGDELPCLEIEDWPEFAERGFMLDISRGRVPDRAERLAITQRLTEVKLNRLELYTEHTFQYAGHEPVWRDTDALSRADVRQLDDWCRAAHIRFVANQNCFGHMEHWLRHATYAPLAETHDTFTFEGIELEGPFSLCPIDPRALELVRDLLDQLLPNFTSATVNVNCDETQDVGQGRSRDAVASRGAFEVYAAHVNATAEHCVAHGFEPQFWADIALHYPERLGELHPALVPIAWGYEPDHPFDEQAALLAGTQRPFLLCCGTSTWRSWSGRTFERRGNLDNVIAAALAHRPRGLLIAEWGDCGHEQVEPLGRLGIAEFAARAWNPSVAPDPRAISLHVYGDRSLRIADWIADFGDVDLDLRRRCGVPDAHNKPTPLRNANATFEALHPSGFPNNCVMDADSKTQVLARINALRARLPQSAPGVRNALETALAQVAESLG